MNLDKNKSRLLKSLLVSMALLPAFASAIHSRKKKDIPVPFNIFRDGSKRVELDQNLDWDRSTLQSIYISGTGAEFVVEVPLLNFHKLFSHDPAYLHKIQQVRATISFPNVCSIKTTFLDRKRMWKMTKGSLKSFGTFTKLTTPIS